MSHLLWYTLYLFQDDSVPVELESNGGSVLDLCWYSEPKCCQLPHLSQKGDKFVTVVHPQLAITMTQLHKTTTCLKPTEKANKREDTVIHTLYMYASQAYKYASDKQRLFEGEGDFATLGDGLFLLPNEY